jgi:hypothetical protein
MSFAGSVANTHNRSFRVSPILVAMGYRCFLVWFDLVMPLMMHQPTNTYRTLPRPGSAFNGRSQKEGIASKGRVAQLDLVHGGHKQRSSSNRVTVWAKKARSVFVPEGLYERSLAVYCLE